MKDLGELVKYKRISTMVLFGIKKMWEWTKIRQLESKKGQIVRVLTKVILMVITDKKKH